MEKILQNKKILAIIARASEWPEGLSFITKENDYLQAGFWNYKKGQILPAHIHLDFPKHSSKTQELVFVRKGRLKISIFSEKEKFLQAVELGAGDTAVLFFGGHGYEILEDGTQVLEVKNGPYLGSKKDRKKI